MDVRKTSILILIGLCLSIFSFGRTIEELQYGWKFTKGNPENAASPDFDDSKWQDIKVPHDWAIAGPFIKDGDGNTGKLPWKGEGWYRRNLELPNDLKGKRVVLIFDGVMAFPEVFVNGKFAGKWDYGYNSFHLDITDHIRAGNDNLLAVYANTIKHDSRWYPGAGIYRKVQMLILDEVHIDIWGVNVQTPIIRSNNADIRINTRVKNNSFTSKSIKLIHEISDRNGRLVLTDTIDTEINGQKSSDLESNLNMSSHRLWDLNDPYLYKLKSILWVDGNYADVKNSKFGIREIEFKANDGFHLNGKRVQLKGVNLHHDHGPLGAAFFPRAMERQLEIMIEMGVNAIRNSHNVAAPEVLDMCDRMGILVFNEIFDKYDAKADILDTTHFDEFSERNIRNFVLRDRIHPSVFLWSVGNEIPDVQMNEDNGFQRLHTMVNYVKKYDPTRPVTLVCDNQPSAELRHFDYYDVHAWNYGRRYTLARKLEPEKSVVISESASTLSTRGFYEFPLPKKKTDFTKSLQVSSYDLNAPWWAEVADDDFMWQEEEPYVAGEFVWTGFDYLGEPTPYNNSGVKEMGMGDKEASRSSYFGVVDLVGIPKDRFYLYRSYWRPEVNDVHILPHWNWPKRKGKETPVFVYTNGDCAELFLNGKLLGKKCKDRLSENSIERYRLMWNDVKYEEGELKAIAYRNKLSIATDVVETTGKAEKIKLTVDRDRIKANGKDLSYILVEALDGKGREHPLANDEITLSIHGPGKILGVGNGNPQSFDSFQSNKVKLFYGKAVIIVGSEQEKGHVRIKVESPNLHSNAISIHID